MPEIRQGEKLRWQRDIDQPFTLDDRRQVMGTGPDVPVKLAFIGEAPGKDEEQKGEPFVGKAGRYLHHYLGEAGIYSPGCYFTNVIDRRPDNNDIKSTAAKEAIKRQNKALWEELAWLKSRGVEVIVALGNVAKDFFGIKESITKCRGSIYEVTLNWEGLVTDPANEPYDFVVMPTYHPSFIMRGKGNQKKNDNMRSDLKLAWIEDLKKAHELASKGYTRPIERFTTSPTFDQVVETCQTLIGNKSLIALDIETSGFNPKHDKVVCIGMAWTGEDGICVPMYKTGPDVARETRYWTPSQEATIKQWLERVFVECPLLLQNAVFDVGYLQEAGWNIHPDSVKHDTLLLHHSIVAELPHNLGFITSVYGHTPYWKGEFLTRDMTIWEMDFHDLQTYNIRDCIVLHQVTPPMLEDMDELGTHAAYEESLRLIGPIIEMQQTGVLINRGRYNKWKKKLKETAQQLQDEMLALGNLPDNFTFTPANVTLFLYDIKSSAMEKAAEWEKHREGSAIRKSKRELHELVQQVTPLWSHSYRGHFTDSGNPSLDKTGIAGLRIFANNRLAALSELKRRTSDHDTEEVNLRKFVKWLDLYSEWKRVEKMESMFRDLPIRQDGRLHPGLLIHGTATGRLSCSKPNLQQWNKDEGADEAIREIIVAPKGHYIVAADYSNLEFRVMAHECQDPKMLQILNDGLNQHDENTKALFGIDESSPKWKTYRAAAKQYQFASQYGAKEKKIHTTLTVKVPEANLTIHDVRKMIANFRRTYHGWAEWCDSEIERVVGKFEGNRLVESGTRISQNAFGRKRILYSQDYAARNQALNNPSQSGAAHIMNDALYRIWRRLHTEGLRSRLQIQIHDEVRLEVPADELATICNLVREEMEKPVQYRDETVIFPVEVEVGRDWHHLHPCKEYL